MSKPRKGEPWYAGYLRDSVRRIWGWHPERKKALRRAQWPGPRQAGNEQWKCEGCGAGPLTSKERDVDHIIGCESLTGFDGWGAFIARTLDVTADGLKVLCSSCHDPKSAAENALRRSNKKKATDE